ncbi:MAG TPA: arabinogalactan endo-1,4-beta-galactosidase [Ruminococcus sp.]|nr:arabinogalactan endo-1,4-beta-galactosidase [Ruminococcus sp.]
MKNRKRLAVLMAGVNIKTYQHMFLDGIISQAFALNYDVVIFAPFTSYENRTEYQLGENHIFDLVNYEEFDAVLYAPCALNNHLLREMVENQLRERCHVPVIALESDNSEFHDIMVDDETAFELVTTHLIEKHHLKKIICLTGFKDNLQAELRLQGYKNVMEKHGLAIPEEYVIYGDFWKQAGIDLAERIASGKIEKPEGIVCCCDTVAISLCNRLIELGVKVPQDILIVGYDAGSEAEENVPSITTYVRPIVDMGIQGVLKAHELITGEKAVPIRQDKGRLVLAESCGCGRDFKQTFEQRQKEIHDTEDFRKIFESIPMAECLNSTTTLNELLNKIMDHFYLINGFTDWYMCLCDQWDDISKNTDNPEDYNHYTDSMHLRISCTNYIGCVIDEVFPKSQILPILHEDREKPCAYYVTPLHFNERCFGYTALGYGDRPMAFDSLYHAWIRNVNNALEFMRIRNNFNSMTQRLFTKSIRDTLTGIYNRQGYKHFSEELFEKAKKSAPEKKLLILAADLDCLKIINDTYGHLEGDNAISVVANALNTCFEYGEICARTGGDEFLVIGCADYSKEKPEQYLDYIRRFFERYNADSGKPYQVEASLGYVCETVKDGDTLQSFMDIADTRMYENKVMRKKNRR